MYIEKIKELSKIENESTKAKMWELVKLESRWVEKQLVFNSSFDLKEFIIKNPEVSQMILTYAQVENKFKEILSKRH